MESDKKKLLFSLYKKDFRIEFFRAGKKGGQKQNKTSSACRITHIESGAVGESRNYRSQLQNKKTALQRLIKSEQFKKWLRLEVAIRAEGYSNLEKKIDEMMKPENLLIECGVASD